MKSLERTFLLLFTLVAAGLFQMKLMEIGQEPWLHNQPLLFVYSLGGSWFTMVFLDVVVGNRTRVLDPSFGRPWVWGLCMLAGMVLTGFASVAAPLSATGLLRDVQALAVLLTCIRLVQWNSFDREAWPLLEPRA